MTVTAGRPRALEPGMIANLLTRYTAGEKVASLCQTFGISERSLRKYRLEAGVPPRPDGRPRIADEIRQAIRLEHAGGEHVLTLADKYRCCEWTVYHILREDRSCD